MRGSSKYLPKPVFNNSELPNLSTLKYSKVEKMSTHAAWNRKSCIFICAVLAVLVQATHSQSYLLTLGQNQRNFYSEYNSREVQVHQSASSSASSLELDNSTDSVDSEQVDNNSTVIIIKNTLRDRPPNELSQTAMDIITIVWYVATFLALAAFFLLMACSDRRCSEAHRNGANGANETPLPPPTPSPSYSEFAPPSYETVMKLQHDAKTSIFVIPFTLEGGEHKDENVPQTPAVNFYTINELQKLGS